MHVRKIEKLTGEKWVNLFGVEYEHAGHTGRWVFASRKPAPLSGKDGGSDAVIIIPVLKRPGEPNRLVMIREMRVPVGEPVISLPAGLIDEGESVEATARREIIEETGFELAAVTRVSPSLYPSAGLTDESVVLAFAEVRDDGKKPDPQDGESIEVLLVDYKAACEMLESPPSKIDLKAWMVLLMYRQMGRIE
jgi:ADP-ribose pyrophosphatase